MTFQQICKTFTKVDTDGMSRAAKVKLLASVASKTGLTKNQVVNLLRDKRDALQKPSAELLTALYRARRCYHAGLGR